MVDHHRAELVVDALKMAAGRGALKEGCSAHSDRGSECAAREYSSQIRELKSRQSMGRTGSRDDYAAAESFFGLFKAEIGTIRLGVPRVGQGPCHPLHRGRVQPHSPAEASRVRVRHPGRDQEFDDARPRPRSVTIRCPRSAGTSVSGPSTLPSPPAHAQPLWDAGPWPVAGRAPPRDHMGLGATQWPHGIGQSEYVRSMRKRMGEAAEGAHRASRREPESEVVINLADSDATGAVRSDGILGQGRGREQRRP